MCVEILDRLGAEGAIESARREIISSLDVLRSCSISA
jgi:hypothetical protein